VTLYSVESKSINVGKILNFNINAVLEYERLDELYYIISNCSLKEKKQKDVNRS